MSRYCFYIDGFNVYYALREPAYQKYKWLNYRKLAENVASSKDMIAGIFYFTALVRWKPDSARRHKNYITVLRWAGVEAIEGRFQNKNVTEASRNKPVSGYYKSWQQAHPETTKMVVVHRNI